MNGGLRKAKRKVIKDQKDLFKYKKKKIKDWKKEGMGRDQAKSMKKSAKKTFKEAKKEIRGYTDY